MKKGNDVAYITLSGGRGTGKVFKIFLNYVIIQDKKSGVIIINKKRVTKL